MPLEQLTQYDCLECILLILSGILYFRQPTTYREIRGQNIESNAKKDFCSHIYSIYCNALLR